MSTTKTFTMNDGTDVSVTGTGPFAKSITGMTSTDLEVFSADGSRAQVRFNGELGTRVFVNSVHGNTVVDEIVTKANAA